MADVVKILAQFKVAVANTLEDVTAVPSGKSWKISSITVCNTGNTSDDFDLKFAVAGAADTDKQFVIKTGSIGAVDTFFREAFVGLSATDKIRFRSTTGNSVLQVFGVESDA